MEGIELKKPDHTILHMATNFPTSLWDMKEISKKVKIPYERVKSLTEAGYMPHYVIDGGEPLYKLAEVKSWLNENLIQHCRGKKFPIKFKLNGFLVNIDKRNLALLGKFIWYIH